MIPVNVDRTLLLNLGNDFVVLLRSDADQRSLPISIGQFEAQSIAIKLNAMEVPRPLTHDLLKSVLDSLDCALERVEICDLREDTFYARLLLRHLGAPLEIDSRPSDAVALALRCGAPILIDDQVMERGGIVFSEEKEGSAEGTAGDAGGRQAGKAGAEEPSSALQVLQRKLAQAVADERYEQAARLRDEIKKLTASN